jgi:ABC-2 type transport system permease protein
MRRLWVIARKDIRESLRSRSTFIYLIVMFVLSISYFSSYSARMDSVLAGHPTAEVIRQNSQAILDSFASVLPMMFSIWICTIFATYAVVVEKAKRNLESLMVTPLSLKQLWMGKVLAVALPSVIAGLSISVIIYMAMNFIKVIPQVGTFLWPGWVVWINAFILVPCLVFAIVSLVTYLQLIMGNPRFASFIFLAIFFLLFFGMNILAGMGIFANFALIYLGVAVICGALSWLLSRSLTKERVMLSSKE